MYKHLNNLLAVAVTAFHVLLMHTFVCWMIWPIKGKLLKV